jgi:cytochrome c-type biogenesis protein
MIELLRTQLYQLEQFANHLVSTQLTHLTVTSAVVIFLAGLLTSLTPCMLSMLPILLATLEAMKRGVGGRRLYNPLGFH